ncbi:MAG: hypothetical protein QOD40_1221 [Alphaproteobacteria bacterium]|jgi:hypothetical protein|nr:hypothetical protein [Alphaproteobacteria bacterium]
MRRATQQPPEGASDASVETTTRHMADAVSFLIRVAADAGLPSIANNLSTVRVHLLDVASEQAQANNSLKEDNKSSP